MSFHDDNAEYQSSLVSGSALTELESKTSFLCVLAASGWTLAAFFGVLLLCRGCAKQEAFAFSPGVVLAPGLSADRERTSGYPSCPTSLAIPVGVESPQQTARAVNAGNKTNTRPQ